MVKYFEELNQILQKIEATDAKGGCVEISKALKSFLDAIKKVEADNKKIIFIGNGGSAAIASHMAIDFCKNSRIKAVSFNDPSQLTCLSNDYGYEHVFEKPIEMFAEEGDLLVAISSSGRSENILKGVKAGRLKKCMVVTMSGFKKDNQLRKLGDINFYVPSDSYGFVELSHSVICHLFADATYKNPNG